MNNNQDIFNNNPQTSSLDNQQDNNQMYNQFPNSNLEMNDNNIINNQEELNPMMDFDSNKFINSEIETNDTSLNNLNIDGAYNNMPKIDYSQDPKVKENLNQIKNKKNTVTVGPEAKVFLIIVIVLLIFIIFMPTIFDAIREINQ